MNIEDEYGGEFEEDRLINFDPKVLVEFENCITRNFVSLLRKQIILLNQINSLDHFIFPECKH